eukprot:6464685-Amphidinium_carterae.1
MVYMTQVGARMSRQHTAPAKRCNSRCFTPPVSARYMVRVVVASLHHVDLARGFDDSQCTRVSEATPARRITRKRAASRDLSRRSTGALKWRTHQNGEGEDACDLSVALKAEQLGGGAAWTAHLKSIYECTRCIYCGLYTGSAGAFDHETPALKMERRDGGRIACTRRHSHDRFPEDVTCEAQTPFMTSIAAGRVQSDIVEDNDDILLEANATWTFVRTAQPGWSPCLSHRRGNDSVRGRHVCCVVHATAGSVPDHRELTASAARHHDGPRSTTQRHRRMCNGKRLKNPRRTGGTPAN